MLVRATEPVLVELDVERSADLLTHLAAGHSETFIAPTADAPGVPATVTKMSQSVIEVTIDDHAHVSDLLRTGCTSQVRFTIKKEHYCFDTPVMSLDRVGESWHVRVRRPRRVSLRQRRRFWRTPVRSSTTVTLHVGHKALSGSGAMLNVSRAGLACLVDHDLADSLYVGETVGTTFHLDGDADPYSVTAELKAKTPTSDSARTILRLEFQWMGDNELCDRLDRITRSTTVNR